MSALPSITVETDIGLPVSKVWGLFTNPADVMKWNHASDDWHTPQAENDFRPGGTFRYVMAAKDGSASFDFEGTYSRVEENKAIEYMMPDGRKVIIEFSESEGITHVSETFDPETTHAIEMQKAGWQSILNNFKQYCESSASGS